MLDKADETGISRDLLRHLNRYESFPIKALEAVAKAREALERIEHDAVVRARALGATYEDLAIALGVSRQTIFNRYGKEDAVKDPPSTLG